MYILSINAKINEDRHRCKALNSIRKSRSGQGLGIVVLLLWGESGNTIDSITTNKQVEFTLWYTV